MTEGWGDDELARIAAYVSAREGYCHHERCLCPSCGSVAQTTTGRCPSCTYPLDNHSLVRGGDTIVCPVGERDVVN